MSPFDWVGGAALLLGVGILGLDFFSLACLRNIVMRRRMRDSGRRLNEEWQPSLAT